MINNFKCVNMKILKLLIITLFSFVSFSANAQSSCDKLFSTGVKLQQTMTVASQNKAISYFEKAKVCYDAQSKKDLCDQQIKACRNIIAQLSKGARKKKHEKESVVVVQDTTVVDSTAVEPAKRDVRLSVDCVYLKFKGKGGEFKKVKVMCNYPDWKVTEKPEWINCSVNDDSEIVVEAEKNPLKEERSGVLTIECDDQRASFTVIQEKNKKFVIL